MGRKFFGYGNACHVLCFGLDEYRVAGEVMQHKRSVRRRNICNLQYKTTSLAGFCNSVAVTIGRKQKPYTSVRQYAEKYANVQYKIHSTVHAF